MKQIWNFIASLKKPKVNSIDMSKTATVQDKPRVFQWIKGDNFGQTVILESQDKEFFHFTDGSRIYKNIAKEFLLESLDGDEPLPGVSNIATKPSVNQSSGEESGSLKAKSDANNSPNNSPQHFSQTPPTTPVESPLQSLITKLSQKNVETVDFKLGINLPKREVFTLLLENSDENEGDLIDTITESVVSKIEIDNLKNYIKEQLNIYIKNYYNG